MPEVNTKTISIERLKRFLDDLPATSPLSKQSVAGELWHPPVSTTGASITSTSNIVQFDSYLFTIINGELWWAPVSSNGISWARKDTSVTYNKLAVITYNSTSRLILCTNSGIKYMTSALYGASILNSNVTTGNFIIEPVVSGTRVIIGSADSKTSATNSILYSDDGGVTWTTATSTSNIYFDGNGISYTYNETQYVLLGGTKTVISGTGEDGYAASNDNGVTWYFAHSTVSFGGKYFIPHTINNELRIFCTGVNEGLYYFIPSMLSFETSPTYAVYILQKNYPDNIGASTRTSSGYFKPPIAIEHNGGTRLILADAYDNTGIYYSDDGGTSFTLATGTNTSIWCIPIQIIVNSVKRLITITRPFTGSSGSIIYSDDDGTTWTNAISRYNCASMIADSSHLMSHVTPFIYLSSTGRLLVSTSKGMLYSDNNEMVPDFSDKSDDGKFVTRDFLKDTISDLLTYLDIRLS